MALMDPAHDGDGKEYINYVILVRTKIFRYSLKAFMEPVNQKPITSVFLLVIRCSTGCGKLTSFFI
jgi:hypothetical protein